MKRATLFIFAAALVFTSMAYADSIGIVLDSPTLSNAPGNLITFSGTITNAVGDPVYLNSDTITLPGFDSSAIDDSPFAGLTPLFLDANSSSGDVNLFNILIPGSSADGSYDGSFTVFGGAGPGSTNVLGSVSFIVQVASDVSPVPEPASLPTLAVALVLVAANRLRRRIAC